MFMLRKWKVLAAAAVMAVSMIMPSAAVYAAELSQETIEVSGGEKRHTVVAYGKAVAIVYPDGRTDIIANNPSGKIDVMIDGNVTKGMGTVVIPARNGTNIVLEEGSFIVNGITDEQADKLKNMVAAGMAADAPVASALAIEGGEGMQGARAFDIDAKGGLLASDGSAASVSVLSEVRIKTPDVVYREFSEAMEESVRAQEEAARIERAIEAAARREKEEATGTEDEDYLQDCAISGHTFVDCIYPDDSPLTHIDNLGNCYTGLVRMCTKCYILDFNDAIEHIHGEDYCKYCGYNIHGEKAEETPLG